MPYVAYAHWFLLHRVLTGAGVTQVQMNSDIDSLSRAAFLSAFADEVKQGDAHAFFVRYTKHQTIDERRRILKQSKRQRAAFRRTLPKSLRKNRKEVARRMMKAKIEKREQHGKWQDEWVTHPLPTQNEPEKAMTWLTADSDLDEDRRADMFLRAGLGVIDNVFQKTRRLCNAIERPIDAAGGKKAVWHGYAPYNPAMLEKPPVDFSGREQLRVRGRGRGHAGDAAGVGQAAPRVRGYRVAGTESPTTKAGPAAREEGYRNLNVWDAKSCSTLIVCRVGIHTCRAQKCYPAVTLTLARC